MPTAFDPSTLLNAADHADQTQLTELEKEVAVLGGRVVQLVRDVVESIHTDDKASIATQIANAQRAKALLTQVNTQLRPTPERPSEATQPAADSASSPPAKKVKKAKKAAAPGASAPSAQPTAKKTATKSATSSAPAQRSQQTTRRPVAPGPTQPPAAAPAPTTTGGRARAFAKKAIANLNN